MRYNVYPRTYSRQNSSKTTLFESRSNLIFNESIYSAHEQKSSSLSSRAMINSCKPKTYGYLSFRGRTNVGHGIIEYLSTYASVGLNATWDAALHSSPFRRYCYKNRVAGRNAGQEVAHTH